MVRPKGTGFANHTKTLMKRVSLGISYILLPTIGERLGEWFEILLRTRRIRWL